MTPDAFAHRVAVYRYRPGVFADPKLHVGLLADASALGGIPWYIRPQESDVALFGMDALARFIIHRQIPGLDLSAHQKLSTMDVEMLFAAFPWSHRAATHRFRILKMPNPLVDDRAMTAIARLQTLESLTLGEKITDTGLARLKSLKNLKALFLNGRGITDKGADALSSFKDLERLGLQGTQTTDLIIAALQTESLKQLDMSARMTDAALKNMRAIKTLEQLDASQATLSAQGLNALSQAPAFHTLFAGAWFSDPEAAVLAGLGGLKRLDVRGARLSESGVRSVAALSRLEELALSGTSLPAGSLAHMARLPSLRYLDLRETGVSLSEFKGLGGFKSLQVLAVTAPPIKADDLLPIVRLPNLHTLIINGVPMSRRLIEYLRDKSRRSAGIIDWLVPLAYAESATEADVEHVLQLASLPERQGRRPFDGLTGLRDIHEKEALLDEVIPAVHDPMIDTFQETEKNFLGEIVIDAGRRPAHD